MRPEKKGMGNSYRDFCQVGPGEEGKDRINFKKTKFKGATRNEVAKDEYVKS